METKLFSDFSCSCGKDKPLSVQYNCSNLANVYRTLYRRGNEQISDGKLLAINLAIEAVNSGQKAKRAILGFPSEEKFIHHGGCVTVRHLSDAVAHDRGCPLAFPLDGFQYSLVESIPAPFLIYFKDSWGRDEVLTTVHNLRSTNFSLYYNVASNGAPHMHAVPGALNHCLAIILSNALQARYSSKRDEVPVFPELFASNPDDESVLLIAGFLVWADFLDLRRADDLPDLPLRKIAAAMSKRVADVSGWRTFLLAARPSPDVRTMVENLLKKGEWPSPTPRDHLLNDRGAKFDLDVNVRFWDLTVVGALNQLNSLTASGLGVPHFGKVYDGDVNGTMRHAFEKRVLLAITSPTLIFEAVPIAYYAIENTSREICYFAHLDPSVRNGQVYVPTRRDLGILDVMSVSALSAKLPAVLDDGEFVKAHVEGDFIAMPSTRVFFCAPKAYYYCSNLVPLKNYDLLFYAAEYSPEFRLFCRDSAFAAMLLSKTGRKAVRIADSQSGLVCYHMN